MINIKAFQVLLAFQSIVFYDDEVNLELFNFIAWELNNICSNTHTQPNQFNKGDQANAKTETQKTSN